MGKWRSDRARRAGIRSGEMKKPAGKYPAGFQGKEQRVIGTAGIYRAD